MKVALIWAEQDIKTSVLSVLPTENGVWLIFTYLFHK